MKLKADLGTGNNSFQQWGGSPYRLHYMIILIIRTPKQGPLILGNPQREEESNNSIGNLREPPCPRRAACSRDKCGFVWPPPELHRVWGLGYHARKLQPLFTSVQQVSGQWPSSNTVRTASKCSWAYTGRTKLFYIIPIRTVRVNRLQALLY